MVPWRDNCLLDRALGPTIGALLVVSRDGIVYEADLGAATEAIVAYIDRFNPDQSWSVVGD